MPSTKARVIPTLDAVKKAMHAQIDRVTQRLSDKGNVFFALPGGFEEKMQLGDTVGVIQVSWSRLQDAPAAQAATAERTVNAAKSMSAAERQALIDSLLALNKAAK